MQSKLVFLDTETTGQYAGEDRLIQLAYKTHPAGEVVNELFKPPTSISFGAMAVHHITETDIADKPTFSGSKAYTKLQKLLETHTIVAHNAPYDIGILKTEGIKVQNYICTYKLANNFLEFDSRGEILYSRSLQYLRYALELNEAGVLAHDAAGDIIVLEKLFFFLWEKVKESLSPEVPSDNQILEHMEKISSQPLLIRQVRFGKYRGKTWSEVAATDPGYLKWLIGKDDLDIDLKYTINHYLKAQEAA